MNYLNYYYFTYIALSLFVKKFENSIGLTRSY